MTDIVKLSLIIPNKPIDPAGLSGEFDRLDRTTARRLAWVHNTLVETAGDAVGRRSDVVKRFAVSHGATAEAADRFVTQWTYCRKARDAMNERIGAWRPMDTLLLGVEAPRLAGVLQAADARGLKAVLAFLLAMTAEGCGIREAHDLTTFLDASPTIRTPHAMAAALTALIGLGMVRVEAEAAPSTAEPKKAHRPDAKAAPAASPAAEPMELELSDIAEPGQAPASVVPAPVAPQAEADSEPSPDDKAEEADDEANAPVEWDFDDAALAEALTDEPVTLEAIRSPLVRLGKKAKRLYAWVHNQLVAAISQKVNGSDPLQIETWLVIYEARPQTMERALRQWKAVLSMRDAMEPLARSMKPSQDEAQRLMQEAFRRQKTENQPLVALLRVLLMLFVFVSMRKSVSDLFYWNLKDMPEEIRTACRCALLAMGGEALLQETLQAAADLEEMAEDEETQDEEECADTSSVTVEDLGWETPEESFSLNAIDKDAKAAKRLVENFMPSFSPTRQMLFMLSLKVLWKTHDWMAGREDIFVRCSGETGVGEAVCAAAHMHLHHLLKAAVDYIRQHPCDHLKYPLGHVQDLAEPMAMVAAAEFHAASKKLDAEDARTCERCMKAVWLVGQSVVYLTDKERQQVIATITDPLSHDYYDGYLFFLDKFSRAVSDRVVGNILARFYEGVDKAQMQEIFGTPAKTSV